MNARATLIITTAEHGRLLRRIEELEALNLDLRRDLALSLDAAEIDALMRAWKLTGNGARIVLALYRAKHRFLTRAQLEAATVRNDDIEDVCEKLIAVMINCVRRKLGWAAIRHARRVGYALSPATRDRVAQILAREGLGT